MAPVYIPSVKQMAYEWTGECPMKLPNIEQNLTLWAE